jgi:electron transport complex protein RnfC
LKTFKLGGIHPEENKISAHQPIAVAIIPNTVYIPVSQHLGAPAKPIVEKGDVVKTGQLIAKGDGFISANVHSSVSGKVIKVDEIVDFSGYRRLSIIIESEGDEWEDSIDMTPTLVTECSLDSKTIIDKINEMGIVGMGGATFPSYVKLNVPQGKKAEYLLINGVSLT